MFINYIKCPITSAIDIYLYTDSAGQAISITGQYSIIPFAYDAWTGYIPATGHRVYFSGQGFWNGSGIAFGVPIYLQDNFIGYSSGTGYIGAVLTGNLLYTGNSIFSGRYTGILYDPTISLQEPFLKYQSGQNFFGYCLTGNILHSGNNNLTLTTTGVVVDFIYQIYDAIDNYPTGVNITLLSGMTYLHGTVTESLTGLVSQNDLYQSFSAPFSFSAKNAPNFPSYDGVTSLEFWFKADSLSNEPVICGGGAQIKVRNVTGGFQLYSPAALGLEYTATGFITTGQWYHIGLTMGIKEAGGSHINRAWFYVNGEIAGDPNYFYYSGFASGINDSDYSTTVFTGYYLNNILTGVALGSGDLNLHPASGEVVFNSGLWLRSGTPTGGSPTFTSLNFGGIAPAFTGQYSLVRFYPNYNFGVTNFNASLNTPNIIIKSTSSSTDNTFNNDYQLRNFWNYKYLQDAPITDGAREFLSFGCINSTSSTTFSNIVYPSAFGSITGVYSITVPSSNTGTPLPLQ